MLAVAAACSGGGGTVHPIDAMQADAPPGCGNGVKEGIEVCDGSDLGSASCSTATAPGWTGVLSCTSLCALDISGCNPPTTTWNDVTKAANWAAFDVTTLFPGAKGFAGAVFDGRYLYLMPNNNGAADGVAARFDTQGGFGASGSWETFDIATISSSAKGYVGGAFDGRYVYYVPYNNGTYHGLIARFDTHGSFGSPSAWATFDISTVNAGAKGYIGATFDGRYIYLSPHYNGTGYHGKTARYDTQGDFTMASSWQVFDMATANAGAMGFLGTAFDGRYVYYAPYYNNTAYHGLVARFDTKAAGGFTAAASWSFFNVASVNANAVGFYAIAFDGKYLYLGQYYNGAAATPAYGGLVVRYDTTADFSTAGSYGFYNTGITGFVGASFDGRHVYFAPHYDGTNYADNVVRFDTQGAGFTNSAAWSTYATSALNTHARGFHGAAFDGQYMYMVPSNDSTGAVGVVARFNAKSPSWLPLGWNANFTE